MRLTSILVSLLVLGLSASSASAQPRASAPIVSDPEYFLPPLSGAGAWTSSDEAWYRRNRAFATIGKVLTVLGIATSAIWIPTDSTAALVTGLAAQYTGQIIWSAAELRGAKGMQRRGVHVTRVPGILSVCGAFLLSPLLWVAGPVQSKRSREAHDNIFSTQTSLSHVSSYGLAAQLTF